MTNTTGGVGGTNGSGTGPVVATGNGLLRGSSEGAVAAFRGIPYAASPVGALRFAAPSPQPGWSGVRDAVRPGPAVPQGPSRLEAVMGERVPDWDEDGCLTLNVWTPSEALPAPAGAPAAGAPAPAADGVRPRPVLLWFHGGGFSSGSGGWDWYDGARLADLGNLVVVTANYRLGPLGYLYLPEFGVDNAGARDQGAALRWVRENIAAFGGDPESVTVGGQSAGAYSALALALDPATGGSIRRVIAQSGPWGLPPQDPATADAAATAYLSLLGIARDRSGFEQLRTLPVQRLLDAYRRLGAERSTPGDPTPPMYPVLGGAGVPQPLLPAAVAGGLGGKDLLLGTVADEMTAFGHRGPGSEAATHRFFGVGTTELAEHRAAQGTPAHVYRFARRPSADVLGLGATHCAELPFLFGTFDAYPAAPMLGAVSASDRALADAFGGALAAFTATGAPGGDWAPYRTAADVARLG
ncbi:carboxylesterase family protein [Streptacidiphilus albus]|uniref:carboxylesterase family protein n=1 Tax=Streptacidiphilus albus TaxID=105425 RepID=UPI000AD962BD|nr:carboxylesterase family protein [Streptacidiphilus albus]